MPNRLSGAAAEFVGRKYGGLVADDDTVVSIGVTDTAVVGVDPERVFVLCVNLSVNTVYLGYDSAVGSARGIILAASGGSYQVDVEEDFMLPTRALRAVATGGSSSMYVVTARRISRDVPRGASNAN